MRRLALALLLPAALAWADGGTIRAREAAGGLVVTVFTAPQPLVVGTADVSVLVQRADGAPVLDAGVTVARTPPDGGPADAMPATRAIATNKLLYAAVVPLHVAGTWTLDVTVRGAAGHARVATRVPVAPAPPPLRALWPWLALPAVAMLLFALHQSIVTGRSRGGVGE